LEVARKKSNYFDWSLYNIRISVSVRGRAHGEPRVGSGSLPVKMFGREFWVTTVDEFERSELTQECFAWQRGIAVTCRRRSGSTSPPALFPAWVSSGPATSSSFSQNASTRCHRAGLVRCQRAGIRIASGAANRIALIHRAGGRHGAAIELGTIVLPGRPIGSDHGALIPPSRGRCHGVHAWPAAGSGRCRRP